MPAVPEGGLVLITGANGYIAGVTVQKFLDRGFRVRGTVRDVSKHQWMLSHYGPNFSLVEIKDTNVKGAFDDAVKGVDGIAHIASATGEGYNPDPQKVIPPAIQNAIGVLEAAAKEPSVKRVVYTSSQAATTQMEPSKPYTITPASWNEECKAAWTMPITQDHKRSQYNYSCSKVEAEQRSFKWVEENKPHFTFNSVVPNVNFGIAVKPEITGFGSTSGILQLLWQGNPIGAAMFPPQWYVDVEDDALLHIAALTQPDVQNERVLAFAGPFSYNRLLEIFKKACPERKFLDKVDEIPDRGTVENERSIELLKRMGKKDGFSTLEETILKWIPQMIRGEEEDWVNAGGVTRPLTAAEQIAKQYENAREEEKSFY